MPTEFEKQKKRLQKEVIEPYNKDQLQKQKLQYQEDKAFGEKFQTGVMTSKPPLRKPPKKQKQK